MHFSNFFNFDNMKTRLFEPDQIFPYTKYMYMYGD